MYLILAAALCSVCVSILFKRCKQRGIDSMQMLMWNYVIASILCWLWFQPDFSHLSVTTTPWWIILLLAFLLPSIFLILGQSLQRAGIIKTELAQRLSVVLSVLAAYLVFQEQVNALKVIGLCLGVASVLSLVRLPKSRVVVPDQIENRVSEMPIVSRSRLNSAALCLLLVWVGYALVDILLKYTSSLGLQFALTLNLTFILAFIGCVIVLLVRRAAWHLDAVGAGLLLGLINFANIALYVQAHQLLKDSPAVVFAGMNILVVILGAMAGGVIFKERFSRSLIIAIVLGIAGVLCLALSLS